MCQWWANRNPRASYRMGPSQPPYGRPKPLNGGVKKSPFQIWTNQLEVDKNVNRTHFRIRRLVVKWRNEQLYSFRQSPKLVKANRVGSSKRLDPHCGDDLATFITTKLWKLYITMNSCIYEHYTHQYNKTRLIAVATKNRQNNIRYAGPKIWISLSNGVCTFSISFFAARRS